MTLASTKSYSIGDTVAAHGGPAQSGNKIFEDGISVGDVAARRVSLTGAAIDANNSRLEITTYGGNCIADWSGTINDTAFNKMLEIEVDGTAYQFLGRAKP